ncbi:hypothetical protein SAMN04488028_105222 [Reichenbachiella agariperforans]|uniref:Uncharacterized protein n=1 Tax=Reichenbachiella agariperforans TaxID=156994 RepID=A0A1M6SZV2_REIAG|nr:hypothetical protein [Reichenbachiella agariperforans]SHK50159.1 hypothetical protein SAMN04488028_105222 [Reichenbachiella agariperforans]
MKKIFVQGLVAGALSSLASVIYLNIYQGTLLTDFDKIINVGSIIGSSFIGCMLIALGYIILCKLDKTNFQGWLNVLICVLSFASIIGPIGMALPLDIEFPELFPGLVVPMHFFPALAYFTIQPFFQQIKIQIK